MKKNKNTRPIKFVVEETVTLIKNKKTGKVVWVHPKGRYIVVQFKSYKESFFPEQLI